MQKNLKSPPSEFPYESKYVNVEGYKIHYVEEGSGKPILFIHGNPTSSYLYRNVLNSVAERTGRRCVAFDLLGFGLSEKPSDVTYDLKLFIDIVDGFIDALDLKDIVLVGEDWGGFFGTFAMTKRPELFESAVLMETFVWPMTWADDFDPKFVIPFKMMRSPLGFFFTRVMNMMVNKMIPEHCPISADALQQYKDFMPSVSSRKAMGSLPGLIPLDGVPKASHDIATELYGGLKNVTCPVLWITAEPGVMVSMANPCGMKRLEELKEIWPQMEVESFGEGNHFLTEEDPGKVVQMISDWHHRKGLSEPGLMEKEELESIAV